MQFTWGSNYFEPHLTQLYIHKYDKMVSKEMRKSAGIFIEIRCNPLPSDVLKTFILLNSEL
jgi:hypothetical protein